MNIVSEWFVVGYGNRAARVLTELAVNWIACDSGALMVDKFEISDLTGEEGLLGAECGGEPLLRDVYEYVAHAQAFKTVLVGGRGYRAGECGNGGEVSSTGNWEYHGP